MNSKRLLLLTIAVVAVGVFALPGTVSLFSGQHAWYNISSQTYNQIPCKKCHADVYEEMMSMEPLSKKFAGESSSPHSYMDENCDLCHRTCFKMTYNSSTGKYEPSSGYTYARGYGSGSEPGVEAHAVSTIECMDCHGISTDSGGGKWNHMGYEEYDQRCYLCHGGLGYYRGTYITIPSRYYYNFISAGGFGLGTTDDDDPSINPRAGKHAAHKAFVLDSINNTELEGSNEACIACHTSIPVKIRWTHGRSLEFNATYDKGLVLPPTHFNTSKYEANGTVNVTSYGNYSGGANTTKFPEPVTVWG